MKRLKKASGNDEIHTLGTTKKKELVGKSKEKADPVQQETKKRL